MRKIDCRNVRREIEEAASGDLLSSSANDHLKNCAQCGTFREERLKLREMLSGLGAVEAPGDFDFRLRARLANERRGGGQPFVMRNLTFGFRSAAVATILLLIGSALLFVNLRTSPNASLSADATKSSSTGIDQSPNAGQKGSATNPITAVEIAPKTDPSVVVGFSPDKPKNVTTKPQAGFRRAEVASARATDPKVRLKTLDMGATEARVLRPGEVTAVTGSTVFPIGTSFQSLKVSLDDGRGSSRTISLPSVSFGSQRVLAQGAPHLLAEARRDW
jgi:hypothetical protein